jgi:hypothetical protein
MATCDVYWKNILVGSGTHTKDSATISSYTSLDVASEARNNVSIAITSSTNAGSSYRARVITDGGTSLTLNRSGGYAT